jgi:hypothetical protein
MGQTQKVMVIINCIITDMTPVEKSCLMKLYIFLSTSGFPKKDTEKSGPFRSGSGIW